ncbi:MAG TPA: hypothetical protein PK358_01805 [Spirochaetota bacterium]|nr:hypothetical protein [Spirochaetota bacterium]HPJ33538.1 hypothetical protein [Spirochaetota bacterium]
MISKLIAELILIALMVFPHGINKGRFDMVDKTGKKTEIDFTRNDNISSIVEGMHEYRVTIHSEKPEVIRYRFVDNGLYAVLINSDNPEDAFELDILPFLVKLDRNSLKEAPQIFKTINKKDSVKIKSAGGTTTLTLKRNRTAIVIDNNLLKN